jgi:hypothetical protein
MRSGARYGEAIFTELRSAIPADASEILDLRAGAGFFLEKFHTIGIAVDAVEQDPDLQASEVRHAVSIDGRCGSPSKAPVFASSICARS